MNWRGLLVWFGAKRTLCVLSAAGCALGGLWTGSASAETVSFTTPGCTSWAAPIGSHFEVTATGAEGAPGGSYVFPEQVLNSGGPGGRADLVSAGPASITAGAQLFVCVDVGGGAGGSSQRERACEELRGFPGCFTGGAGGGASGVSLGGDFSDPLVVAGGGGGGGALSPYGAGQPAYGGGAAGAGGGGGPRELAEPLQAYDDYFGYGGGGASGTEVGAAGQAGVDGLAGAAGSASTVSGPGTGGGGGFGEASGPCFSSPCEGGGGGGGGGGYYGGGGGGGGGIDGGGGGGGSSLVPAGGTVALAPAAAEPQVQIRYAPGPAAVTGAASAIAQTTATLNATVDPDGPAGTECRFEYGPTQTYGSVAPCEPSLGAGDSAVAVSAPVTTLSPKSLYHFRVVATNEGGSSYGADETFETLPNAPDVTSVTPDASLEAGGIPVTIGGVGLAEATAVSFGATSAHFTIDSATSITAIAPAETSGTVQVTVTNAGGTSPTGKADLFTYVPPGHGPAITALSAKKGPAGGGSSLTITGSGFAGVTSVRFGATSASSFTVDSATSITAETPAETAGKVEVTVTTPNGESPATAKDEYTFEGPTVTNISPAEGPQAGGTPVTITGSGFALGAATTFDFGTVPATSVECTSTKTCTAVAPAGRKAQPVNVVAIAGGVKGKKSPPGDLFTYE